MEIQLRLNRLRYFSYHGVLLQEQKVGTHYVVSLRLYARVERALVTDNLSDTVNYATVVEVISSEMSRPSQLIEHVAGRIVDALYGAFAEVYRIELSLSKENPPSCGDIETTEVFVNCSRAEWGELKNERQ